MVLANAGVIGGCVAFSEAQPSRRGHRLHWELLGGTTGHLPDFSDHRPLFWRVLHRSARRQA